HLHPPALAAAQDDQLELVAHRAPAEHDVVAGAVAAAELHRRVGGDPVAGDLEERVARLEHAPGGAAVVERQDEHASLALLEAEPPAEERVLEALGGDAERR